MKVVILAGAGRSTNILLNWLEDHGYDQVCVIMEEGPSRAQIVRYRMKRLGLVSALGQILFALVVVPIVQRKSRKRQGELLQEYDLRDGFPAAIDYIPVESVNGTDVVKLLQRVNPDVVLVNGTRIIKSEILNSVPAHFINIHAGITPKYRGVHGGYWSLWNNDLMNFGVTLHLVDAGVDTGTILAQCRIAPTVSDNFASYPLLQQAAAFPMLGEALEAIKSGQPLRPLGGEADFSKQWFHPTLWQYIAGYFRGVR